MKKKKTLKIKLFDVDAFGSLYKVGKTYRETTRAVQSIHPAKDFVTKRSTSFTHIPSFGYLK